MNELIALQIAYDNNRKSADAILAAMKAKDSDVNHNLQYMQLLTDQQYIDGSPDSVFLTSRGLVRLITLQQDAEKEAVRIAQEKREKRMHWQTLAISLLVQIVCAFAGATVDILRAFGLVN